MGRPKNSKNKNRSKIMASEHEKLTREDQDNEIMENSLDNPGDIEQREDDGMMLEQTPEPSMSKKRKVAPRSGLQFKVGPSFENTRFYRPIYITSTNEDVFPYINARIDRGFENCNGEWIGYKRNYFTLVSCFEFEDRDPSIFFTEKFHIVNDYGEKENISCFALRLVSRCVEDDSPVNLIQHTAKRDRGPQYLPPVYPAISGYLPSHSIIKQASNIRNGDKIDQFNKLFFLDTSNTPKIEEDSILNTYPEGRIATVARYERIQFSASINYRKPTMVNRHFTLKVELLGLLDDGKYAVLASTETQPLIVRGRSPSNYQMSKRSLKSSQENIPKFPKREPNLTYGFLINSSSNIGHEPNDKGIYLREGENRRYKKHLLHLGFEDPTPAHKKRRDSYSYKFSNNNYDNFASGSRIRSDLDSIKGMIDDEVLTGLDSGGDSYDAMFETFDFHQDLNFSLSSSLELNKDKSARRPKTPNESQEGLNINAMKAPNSSCTCNSSFHQLEDSFIEFQKEMSMLQKELKGDATNDSNILVL